MKARKKWTLDSLITSAIRRVWNRCPMRAEALRQALINPEAKRYDQRYRCAICGGEFLSQQVEIHHKVDGPKNESWDSWINRVFLGVNTVTYIDTVPVVNGTMLPSLEFLVREHLEVNCKPCHARHTKEQAAKNKKPKKGSNHVKG